MIDDEIEYLFDFLRPIMAQCSRTIEVVDDYKQDADVTISGTAVSAWSSAKSPRGVWYVIEVTIDVPADGWKVHCEVEKNGAAEYSSWLRSINRDVTGLIDAARILVEDASRYVVGRMKEEK